MNADDAVLVALVNSPRDFELVEREGWYRIPTRHAPRFLTGAQVLAFYFAGRFGADKWTISRYAPVRGHELVRRRDLLPDEPDHPRADDTYYKLELGPLQVREPPIRSKRGRRLLFLWTTWDKFSTASELNDLFRKGPAQDRLWQALKDCDLDAERELIMREGRTRYRVDFLIYCPRGRLAVTIGDGGPPGRLPALRALAVTEEELQEHFETVLDEIKRQARELDQEYLREGQV